MGVCISAEGRFQPLKQRRWLNHPRNSMVASPGFFGDPKRPMSTRPSERATDEIEKNQDAIRTVCGIKKRIKTLQRAVAPNLPGRTQADVPTSVLMALQNLLRVLQRQALDQPDCIDNWFLVDYENPSAATTVPRRGLAQ